MKLLGNLIWLVFGGILISIEYLISSMLLMVTIIGIPFGIQTLKLAIVALWPFGTEIRLKPGNSGCLSSIMNLIWIFIGGFWITTVHILFFHTYMASHLQEADMLTKMSLPDSPRLMMLITGPVIGIISGLVLGLFAFLASRIMQKK